MRLLSVQLKNIRSYREEEVAFPQGITLLAGDIGSGKSTLLLAIEFALFGIARGELVGAALLRHGAREGSVTVAFSVGRMAYRIQRTLRRSASSITQDSGWIETDGQRETLTPSELRARVFEILGYPLQFLGKQRNLLYRFTLYTPQEEMKSILVQASDERIETIRRIFGIDAYRTIQENAQALAKALRERDLVHEEVLSRIVRDEERLRAQLEREPQLAQQKVTLAQERARLQQSLAQLDARVGVAEGEHHRLQEQLRTRAMQERNRTLQAQQIENDLRLLEQKRKRGEELARVCEGLQARLGALAPGDVGELTRRRAQLQQEMEALRQEEGKVIAIIDDCAEPNVEAGTVCPTCRQQVDASHLAHLEEALAARRSAAQRKLERLRQQLAQQRALGEEVDKRLSEAAEGAQLRQRLEQMRPLVRQQDDEVTQFAAAVAQRQELLRQMPPPDGTLMQQAAAAAQALVDLQAQRKTLQQQLLDAERRVARIEQELQELSRIRGELDKIVAEAAQRKAARERDSQLRAWLLQRFTPFTATVERHVLFSINSVFSAAMREWFMKLVDDDSIAVQVDQQFAPVVHQHGFAVDVGHLSGGERTAVSLAYRLALAHTIHALLPHLGTAGLIMLDEPTEGFSREQLERVCEVLRELRMEQIILVSHDQQLEGCVDHILRIRKNGESSVVELA